MNVPFDPPLHGVNHVPFEEGEKRGMRVKLVRASKPLPQMFCVCGKLGHRRLECWHNTADQDEGSQEHTTHRVAGKGAKDGKGRGKGKGNGKGNCKGKGSGGDQPKAKEIKKNALLERRPCKTAPLLPQAP